MKLARWTPFVLATLGAAMPAARASEEFRAKIAQVAQAILSKTEQRPVTVGQFSPTGLPDSNSGPGIEAALTAALETIARGSVRSDARFEVKGDYGLVRSKAHPELKEVKLKARLIEKESSDELVDLQVSATLGGNNSIAQLLQVTAALPPDGTKQERNQEIARRVKAPAVFVHGPQNTLVSSAEGSPYAVEVLARRLDDPNPAQPRPARVEAGKAFVDIQRGELYELKLYNNSDREAAVALSIDGIDVFHFSQERNPDGQPRFTHFILAPKSSTTIVGWHKALTGSENFLSFLVTAYGQGAASKTGLAARGQVGVIHAQFANCRPLPPGARSAAGNETGFGPPRQVAQQAVRYEIEPPHDFVSIRYTR